MLESRVREKLMHGLMRGKRAKLSNLLYFMNNQNYNQIIVYKQE